MKKFWNFKKTGTGGELTLYGEISSETWYGDELTPKQFKQDLDALGDIDTLDIFINSPGGDVFAGLSIYNTIKRHNATVTVTIDGVAASAASIICMAADKIIMPENAEMMIHNASSICWGNKDEMRKLADELERIDGQLAQIYADRTDAPLEDMIALMDAETWMTGKEAFDAGFCDGLEANKQIAACADPKIFARYKHPPEIETKAPETADKGGFLVPGYTVIGIDLANSPDMTGNLPPDNGEGTQPVADSIEAQKRRFALNDKKKIMTEE